jgi:putative DNA primase/helicase
MNSELLPHIRTFISHARRDVHAQRVRNKSKKSGWGYKPIAAPIDDEMLRRHLNGGPHLGSYLMEQASDTTRVAVLDFDDHDGSIEWSEFSGVVKAVCEAAERVGLSPWSVRSGGGRGVHVCFRWDKPQPAKAVRESLSRLLEAHGLRDGTGGVGEQEVEIFPKQDVVDQEGYGSLVALPFARESVPLGADLQPVTTPLMWRSSSPPKAPGKAAGKTRKAPPSEQKGHDIDIVALREALSHLDADDYDRWTKAGLALKCSLGDDGFDLWDEWSKESGKYSEVEAREKWDSFKPRHGGVTVGSIFYWAQQAGWRPPPSWDQGLPTVRVAPGELGRMCDEAEAALLAANAPLYRQGGRLVRPVWDVIATTRGSAKIIRLTDVQPAHLNERFSGAAVFKSYDARKKDWKRVDCPRAIVDAYSARAGDWKLRPLLGVVTAPVLRPDGTVLDQPGYDQSTHLIFEPNGVTFPRVPEAPTRAHAERALVLLKDPIRDFPFVEDQDRAVALSAILTAVVRRALPVAPMHAFTAPTAGTGKSLIVDIASMIATGERAAVTSLGRDKYGDAELEKRLTASMLASDPIISLDNVETPLGGELLCQLTTQHRVKLRPLGKSENVVMPNASAFYATGNNLVLMGDLTRRVLLGSLDARVERPELREFDFEPVEFALAQRAELVVAALTVIRAWLASGEAAQRPPLGSYAEWCQLVREPLMWLGEDDPVLTMEKTRQDDPQLGKLRVVIAAWTTAIGSREVSVGDLIACANESIPPHDQGDGGGYYRHAELREALLAVASKGRDDVNSEALAWWLRKNARRPVKLDEGGPSYRLTRSDDTYKHPKWKLAREDVQGDLLGERTP